MIFVTLARLAPGMGKEFIEALRDGMISQDRMPPDVRLISTYVTYGQYDLVVTCDAPDLRSLNVALKDMVMSGLVTTETLVGQSVEEFIG